MRKTKWIIAIAIIILGSVLAIFTSKQIKSNKEMEVEEVSFPDEEFENLETVKQYNNYTVELSIDQATNILKGIANISYTHEYERVTQEIRMNIDYVGIKSVKINSDPVSFEQKGSNLTVESPFEIKKGEELTMTIEFQGGVTRTNMYDFIPTILSYDEYLGWVEPKGTRFDAFCLIEPANYDVTIHTNKGQYPLGTGSIDDIIASDDTITTTLKANRVRGFGLFLGKQMEREVINTEAGYTIVLYYEERNDITDGLIADIKKDIQTYTNTFGMYPYDQFTVIHKKDLDLKSYPTCIMGDFSKQENRHSDLNEAIGKQWVHYIIGTSKDEECWFNIGLLEYLNKKFTFSQAQIESYIDEQHSEDEEHISDEAIAIKMFYDIEKRIGEEKFIEVLRAYYKKHSFQGATSEDFMEILEEVSGVSVRENYDL